MKRFLLVILLLTGCVTSELDNHISLESETLFQEPSFITTALVEYLNEEPREDKRIPDYPDLMENPEPLTKADEALFIKWRSKLELRHWKIEIMYSDLADYGLWGRVYWNIVENDVPYARIRLLNPSHENWNLPSAPSMEEVVIHELIHVRIGQFQHICYKHPDMIEDENEDITYILARLLAE